MQLVFLSVALKQHRKKQNRKVTRRRWQTRAPVDVTRVALVCVVTRQRQCDSTVGFFSTPGPDQLIKAVWIADLQRGATHCPLSTGLRPPPIRTHLLAVVIGADILFTNEMASLFYKCEQEINKPPISSKQALFCAAMRRIHFLETWPFLLNLLMNALPFHSGAGWLCSSHCLLRH